MGEELDLATLRGMMEVEEHIQIILLRATPNNVITECLSYQAILIERSLC